MLVERGSPVGHLSHRTLGMLLTSRDPEEHFGISFFSVKFCVLSLVLKKSVFLTLSL